MVAVTAKYGSCSARATSSDQPVSAGLEDRGELELPVEELLCAGDGLGFLQPGVAFEDLVDRGAAEALDGVEGAVLQIVCGEQRAGVGAIGLAEEELGGVEPAVEVGEGGAVGRRPHPERAPRVHQES
jgi:hypothetical protein